MVNTSGNIYRVVEMMILPNGSIGEQNPWNYENEKKAMGRFHSILSEAVESAIPFHGCFVLESTGKVIAAEVFDRRNNGLEDNWYWDEAESVWKNGTPVMTEAAE